MESREFDGLIRAVRMLVAAAFVLPPAVVERGPTVCLFRRATGLPCPNCGLARSWTATAHGQLTRGFRLHPLGPPALFVALLVAVMPSAWLNRLKPWASTIEPAVAGLWLSTWVAHLLVTFLEHKRSESAITKRESP